EARQRARSKGLDDDIGLGGEPLEDLLPGRLVQVKRDTALAGVVKPEDQTAVAVRCAVKKRANLAHWVTARRLDLDDVRTHVTQEFGAESAFQVGEVKDTQVSEGCRCDCVGHGWGYSYVTRRERSLREEGNAPYSRSPQVLPLPR